MKIVVVIAYLFEHSLWIWHSRCFLPASIDACQILTAGRQLIHGHHGVRRLLAAQLQHREEVEGRGTHVCQTSDL